MDAAGEESSDIAVSLEEAPGGYRYTITPDREWLAAAERLYPCLLYTSFSEDRSEFIASFDEYDLLIIDDLGRALPDYYHAKPDSSI